MEPGTTFSHYRLLSKIGEGGMGVVWRAEDTILGRSVAIKVLPDVFVGDPERLARFEREAKVLASFNHPNIAAIHGFEEAEGKRFIIMELADGETLANRIRRGALPVTDTLEVCRQIAEGLHAAHEKGIVHRDLKPSNVMVSTEGKVKILDFGLAKALSEEGTPTDSSDSPTITATMTRPGIILGTAAYMSPEQALGKRVDRRTDVWAFGCVLYECLTGKRAFQADGVAEVLAKILETEPDWSQLPPRASPSLIAVIRRCLQKNPRFRLHDIADAWLEVELPSSVPTETTSRARRLSLRWLAAGVATAFLAGSALAWAWTRYSTPAPKSPVVRAAIEVVSGHRLAMPSRTAMAISRDGSFVVYAAIETASVGSPKSHLFLRMLNELEAKPIPGTEGGASPFLSPDNRWVGFYVGGKMKKVPIEGGTPTTLCDAFLTFGASWGPESSIVFSPRCDSGLSMVSADGGAAETLTTPDPKREESGHRLPYWLPGGKALLFTVTRHEWDLHPYTAVLQLKTREWRVLLDDAADARYVPTGHLVFLRQGALMGVRFDPARLMVIGQPFPLVENVAQWFEGNDDLNTGAGQFSVSDSGALIYAVGRLEPDFKNSLVWVDQKGTEEPATPLQLPFFAPRLSPDGRRIAYVAAPAGRDQQLWLYDLTTGANSRLTTEGSAMFPVWTPDGERVVFSWHKSLAMNLFWQVFDGSAPMERLTTSTYRQFAGSWSADGTTLVFVEQDAVSIGRLAQLDLRSRLTTTSQGVPFRESFPEISPNGRWLAYVTPESTRAEVYVRPFPGPGMKRQVSNEGGTTPLWSRDGKQIYYRRANQMWVVDVRTDGGLSVSRPRLLFERAGYATGAPIRSHDLSHDGKRFLMVKLEPRERPPMTQMVIVLNWLQELKHVSQPGS